VFAGPAYVNPDYGGVSGITKNVGALVGGDLNIGQVLGRIEPSVEFRALASVGTVSHQYSYNGGPRLEFDYGRFHPYGILLLGYGKITFVAATGSYTKNNSVVCTYGGGLDFALDRHWTIRADMAQTALEAQPPCRSLLPDGRERGSALPVFVQEQDLLKGATTAK